MFRRCQRKPTLISGNVNEVMNLFVRKMDVPASRRNQRWIEFESPARTGRFSILYRAFDATKDQVAGGAALPGGGCVQPPVQIARELDTGVN